MEAPAIPWTRIERSLVVAHRGPNPHKLSLRIPEADRRAAVAMVLWGDAAGARKIVLVQRGFTAPQHPGELAFPGGMVEPGDLDFRHTARRELYEELGVATDLWELGCFPDGVAKARTRFTPVLFRWEAKEPAFAFHDGEVQDALLLPIEPLLSAPWTTEILDRQGLALEVPRLELPGVPLWGATAFVLKAWLDVLSGAPD
ncbi:MAG: CoA pyrophosphatase [Holophagaceae bacterium]|nr:CoA pyrophosphatase [Holophagaceae bacterium]